MGSHSIQAQGIVLFLVAFVLFAAGLANGDSIVLFILAAIALVVSVLVLRKAKALDQDDGKAAGQASSK